MERFINALRQIRATVAQGWTKGTNAVDHGGETVYSNSAQAVAWCLLGAIARTTDYTEDTVHDELADELIDAVRAAIDRLPTSTPEVIETRQITTWNDDPERTQDEVLALLDGMIAEAEATASR